MPRLTLESFDAAAEQARRRHDGHRAAILICAATECVSAKSRAIRDALQQEIRRRGLENEVEVIATGCHGLCTHGPVCVVQPGGVFYERLRVDEVPHLVESHFVKGRPYEDLLYHENGAGSAIPLERDIPFFAKQQRVAFPNRGRIDPESIADAIGAGAYRALRQVLRDGADGDALVRQIVRSGLRGRGGGGFPTGLKWRACLEAARARQVRPVIVCNADAGGGAAVMDRIIVESDPHSVIEGMLIGARALGAAEGFVYIRLEYPLALQRLQKAIAEAREWGFLGRNILGTDFEFDIAVHRGAGAFVCGESTALIASMEGRAPEPHPTYVHSAEAGFRKLPTALNNVETWVCIPRIVLDGPERFAALGSGDVSRTPWGGSSGTKVFSLLGNVRNSGIVEVPMGTTLREIVFGLGGGIPKGRKFKAVQAGGPSGGCLPESALDLPLDFDTLTQAGAMMGSGGLIVMDDRACMVEAARYCVDFLCEESCGKCTPCRDGLAQLRDILTRITRGEGRAGDLELLEDLAATIADGSLCGLGQTGANPVLTTLRYFRDEYETHLRDRRCPGGVCKELIRYTILSNCTGCTSCAKQCPTDAITGEHKKLHVIDQSLCIKCGSCFDVCNDDAVLIQ
jgi:NADH:ubiquinone oxidoreductase subunit F (NADH-binding)/(2Fe-2S) ferredoxin/NAD-dependent dihydropyrimidine dehydrogenase PreA subunit